MYSIILLFSAVLPVALLCFFIYSKDHNKEPIGLLIKLFFLGLFSFLPILVVELMLSFIFNSDGVDSFILIFIFTFFGVALVEEVFKWIIVRFFGYNSKEFDEVYDIIVYSVFVSLGFACIENIGYVFQYGLGNAFVRAILSIPGHMYFAVIMGFFLSKAKVASFNDNDRLYRKNIIYSILFPSLFHTTYDALLFYYGNVDNGAVYLLFLLFHFASVAICIYTVFLTAGVQYNITTKVKEGVLFLDDGGHVVVKSVDGVVIPNFCPICGRKSSGGNFCAGCGHKFK